MNQVSYQLEDTVSGMIWVKFKFCHKIIQCLKQIPGYKYNDKKWYIPTEHMDLLSEKVRKECETEDISISKKRKNMDDREDEIQNNHGYDFVDPITFIRMQSMLPIMTITLLYTFQYQEKHIQH